MSGRARRTGAGSAGLMMVALAAMLLAGCGGGDEESAERMVPGSEGPERATTAGDTALGDWDDEGVAGARADTAADAWPDAAPAGETTAPGERDVRQSDPGDTTPATRPAAERPATTSPPPSRSVAQPAMGGADYGPYSVQAGAFRTMDRARRQEQTLANAGFETVIVSADVQGTTWYRIYVPYLPDLDAANSVAARIQRELGLQTLVRKH
ncbi:MAG: SPOR domain-containing protein [Candidatus Krumholzibacteriia bacterium]